MSTQDRLDHSTPAPHLSASTQLRRLPWVTPPSPEAPDGKPCFLSADDPMGLLSIMADEVEEQQIRDGAAVRDAAKELLEAEDGAAPRDAELRRALSMAVQALTNVVRVAECRGERLGSPEDSDGDDAEPPTRAG